MAHDDSRWRPPKEKNDRKRDCDWWISARGPGRAGPQYGLERALALGTRSVYRLVSASCSSASTENFPIKGPEGQRRTRAITSPMQITRDKARGVGVRGKTHRSQSTVSRLCRAAPPGDSSVPPQKPTPPAARPPPRGAANPPPPARALPAAASHLTRNRARHLTAAHATQHARPNLEGVVPHRTRPSRSPIAGQRR